MWVHLVFRGEVNCIEVKIKDTRLPLLLRISSGIGLDWLLAEPLCSGGRLGKGGWSTWWPRPGCCPAWWPSSWSAWWPRLSKSSTSIFTWRDFSFGICSRICSVYLWQGWAWGQRKRAGWFSTQPEASLKFCTIWHCGRVVRTSDGRASSWTSTKVGRTSLLGMAARGTGHWTFVGKWRPRRPPLATSLVAPCGDAQRGCLLDAPPRLQQVLFRLLLFRHLSLAPQKFSLKDYGIQWKVGMRLFLYMRLLFMQVYTDIQGKSHFPFLIWW